MTQILIVEDQPTDVRVAADIARALGTAVEARTSATAAKAYLEATLDGKGVVPDLIVLDLDLGYDSGHEILRFWHGHPRLRGTRIVVWTVMGEEQRRLCGLFDVTAVVPKWEGAAALERTLKSLLPNRPESASQGPASKSSSA